MKKKSRVFAVLKILSVIILFSTLTLLSVSAKKATFRASGTLDEYNAEVVDGSRIVSGNWRVEIIDGAATLTGHYVEENIKEEPIGTYDTFKLSFDGEPEVFFDGQTWIIEGWLAMDKQGWDTPQYNGEPQGPRYFSTGYYSLVMKIDADGIEFKLMGIEEPYIRGTTHAFIN